MNKKMTAEEEGTSFQWQTASPLQDGTSECTCHWSLLFPKPTKYIGKGHTTVISLQNPLPWRPHVKSGRTLELRGRDVLTQEARIPSDSDPHSCMA